MAQRGPKTSFRAEINVSEQKSMHKTIGRKAPSTLETCFRLRLLNEKIQPLPATTWSIGRIYRILAAFFELYAEYCAKYWLYF